MKPIEGAALWAIGLVVGLVIGIVLGAYVLAPKLSLSSGAGKNNQVQVSGTVPSGRTGTLCFTDANYTLETAANIVSGRYSILLAGGQSYQVFSNYCPSSSNPPSFTGDYYPFYVPFGVTTFTENLVSK